MSSSSVDAGARKGRRGFSLAALWGDISLAAVRVLPAELGHDVALGAISRGLGPRIEPVRDPILAQTLWRLDFATPVGVAAGLDKNAEAVDGLLDLGPGFVEVGAVTPRPQQGNPKPRVFRLAEDRAIVNRLGFNNQGLEATAARLRARRAAGGVVGANIGANKNSVDRPADYEHALRGLWGLVQFFTINVSSPNTEKLRDLQEPDALAPLLHRLLGARDALAGESGVWAPVLLKIAPDLHDEALKAVADVAVECGVDGMVATNTTIARPAGLKSANRAQKGGLSGPPLFERSTEALRALRRLTGGALPLIGVGGVSDGASAYAKVRAGASLVQLYTALIYQGPGVFADIARDLADRLRADGYNSISEAVGADV